MALGFLEKQVFMKMWMKKLLNLQFSKSNCIKKLFIGFRKTCEKKTAISISKDCLVKSTVEKLGFLKKSSVKNT